MTHYQLNPNNTQFWIVFGADQYLHQLTYGVINLLLLYVEILVIVVNLIVVSGGVKWVDL